MQKHFLILYSGLYFWILSFYSCAASILLQKNILFQASTFSALMQGVYDGDYSFKSLMQHGDFGLGTFEGLDGEMVALDGNFYRFPASGKLIRVKPEQLPPFAEVVYFKPSTSNRLSQLQY